MKKIAAVFQDGTRYQTLLMSVFTIGLGYGIYKGLLDNYLAQIVGIGKFDRGIVEFFRELPGFLLIFIVHCACCAWRRKRSHCRNRRH